MAIINPISVGELPLEREQTLINIRKAEERLNDLKTAYNLTGRYVDHDHELQFQVDIIHAQNYLDLLCEHLELINAYLGYGENITIRKIV